MYNITFISTIPVGKYLFKVSKITLEQRPSGRCSNVILLTLNRYLPTGIILILVNDIPVGISSYWDHNSSTIGLSWDAYPFQNWLSPNLLAYQIFYKEVSLTDEHDYTLSTYKNVTVDPFVVTYFITDLDQYREYSIFVGTINDVGLGGTAHIFQRTSPGGNITLDAHHISAEINIITDSSVPIPIVSVRMKFEERQ